MFAVDSAAKQFPEFPVADHMHVSIVAEEIEFSGIPMQLLEFRSNRALADLQKFYASEWHNAMAVADTEEFVLLSHREGDFFQVVQIDRSDRLGSRGILSTSFAFDPSEISRGEPAKGFPMVAHSKVLNDIKAVDGPKHSRTLMIESPESLKRTYDFYDRRFAQEGWSNATSPKATERNVLILSRRSEELNMTFSASRQGTTVVAVLVTHR
ncbi:hypothetical protein KEM63_05905 [Halopseudomonas nanhaiensis]|uniref:hypothetical protein n=1 Tax=Halopseudomonas nanhaiensis TaxID=2830842 RepID=UPI001CC0C4E5|nr:hypothetical protein [Halopseudomonas nanhaiensis]UAW99501.1 hypothetical protein KEM63_05905 [Halopseudomonas nanhaiensis]